MERTAALLCVFAILAAPALAAQEDSLLQRLSALQTKRQHELQTSQKLSLSFPNILAIIECGTDGLEKVVELLSGVVEEADDVLQEVREVVANSASCNAANAGNIFALAECQLGVVGSVLDDLKVADEKAISLLKGISSIVDDFKSCVASSESASSA